MFYIVRRKSCSLWVIMLLLLLPKTAVLQELRNSDIAQKKIDSIRFKDIRDDVAFSILADKTRSIICFEGFVCTDDYAYQVPATVIPTPQKVSLDLEDTTLETAVKELMNQLQDYECIYKGNVINVIPNLSTIKEFMISRVDSSWKEAKIIVKMSIRDFHREKSHTEYPLDKKIEEFSIENKNLTEAMDILLGYLRVNIERTEFDYWPEFSSAYAYVPDGGTRREIPGEVIHGKKMSFTLRDVTVRDILNEFARRQGDRYWVSGYLALGSQRCSLAIAFPLWDAKTGATHFNHYRAEELRKQGKLREGEPYKKVEVDIYPDD